MNHEKALKKVYKLIESDAAFEASAIQADIGMGKSVTEREKVLADLVGEIYKIVHPLFSKCKHPDWEEETNQKTL